MKKLLAVMLMMFTLPSFAGVNGDVGVYSDYLFRGETQSMGNRSAQGWVQADYKGAYGGVWLGEVEGIGDASYEYDLYAGYYLEVNDKWWFDAGVIQYRYDDKAIDHTEEWYVGGGNDWIDVYQYTDMDDRENNYREVNLKMPLVKVVDLSVRHGIRYDDSTYQMLTVSKTTDKGWVLGMEVLDSARDGEFMDSASFFLKRNF